VASATNPEIALCFPENMPPRAALFLSQILLKFSFSVLAIIFGKIFPLRLLFSTVSSQ